MYINDINWDELQSKMHQDSFLAKKIPMAYDHFDQEQGVAKNDPLSFKFYDEWIFLSETLNYAEDDAFGCSKMEKT